ncbi:MAG: hypothetical protein ACI4KA_01810, partial [Oscillospiraceae bacterium]
MKLTIKSLSPISHGAFKDSVDSGNISEFRRVPVYSSERNAVSEIPSISGNAIRGVLRRVLTREYFSANDLISKMTEKE